MSASEGGDVSLYGLLSGGIVLVEYWQSSREDRDGAWPLERMRGYISAESSFDKTLLSSSVPLAVWRLGTDSNCQPPGTAPYLGKNDVWQGQTNLQSEQYISE